MARTIKVRLFGWGSLKPVLLGCRHEKLETWRWSGVCLKSLHELVHIVIKRTTVRLVDVHESKIRFTFFTQLFTKWDETFISSVHNSSFKPRDNGFCCVFISLCQSVLCICLCPSSPQSSVFSFFLSPPSVSSLSILSFSLSLICFCLHLLQFSAQSACLYLFHLNIFFSCGFDRASPCRGIKTNFDQKPPQKTKHEKRFLICGI